MIRLASAGLLAKLEPETLALVEPEHAGGNGDRIGITARTRVLAYNPKKIDEKDLPKSLMDLSDPSWSGRFGFVPTQWRLPRTGRRSDQAQGPGGSRGLADRPEGLRLDLHPTTSPP